MTNPFEREDGVYKVLINDENQHSLWPSQIPTPNGWTIAHNDDTREKCLNYVTEHWTDLRPASLVARHRTNPEDDSHSNKSTVIDGGSDN